LLNPASRRRVLVTHDVQRLAGHIDQAKVVDLHLRPDLLLGQALELAGQTVASVVDADVNSPELFESFLEGGIDGVLLGDIAVESEEVLLGGVVEAELAGVAGSGYDLVAIGNALLDVVFAEACACACYEEDLGWHFAFPSEY
jgi:hypothetical protein